jgi:hypothetical protein
MYMDQNNRNADNSKHTQSGNGLSCRVAGLINLVTHHIFEKALGAGGRVSLEKRAERAAEPGLRPQPTKEHTLQNLLSTSRHYWLDALAHS